MLADLRQENADIAAKTLSDAGFSVSTLWALTAHLSLAVIFLWMVELRQLIG